MTNKIMATLLAGTIALTTITATPVQARNNDVAKVVAGIALLAIIGKVVSDDRKRRHVAPAPQPTRYRLPNRCLRDFETQNGWKRAYGARCLKNHGPRVSLPRSCKRTFWTVQGRRNVYLPGCMSNHGFKVAHR